MLLDNVEFQAFINTVSVLICVSVVIILKMKERKQKKELEDTRRLFIQKIAEEEKAAWEKKGR